jgi:hypothetical protein
MKSRQRTRTVLLALAASIALFWGAVDIVGVPVERLAGQLVWVTLGVLVVAAAAALAGWGLSKRRRAGRHSEDR